MADESKQALLRSLRRHVQDRAVLDAIAAVPRDRFVPSDLRARAWEDSALPIGRGQTISQPLVVAHMCEHLDVRPGDRVLDVGTGSGYHAAVLRALGAEVWSIERDRELSARASRLLEGVTLVIGDGSLGWPPAAPYDAINVAAAAQQRVPPALEAQLAPGGRLVVPVGKELVVVHRHGNGRLERHRVGGVSFVPLIEGGR